MSGPTVLPPLLVPRLARLWGLDQASVFAICDIVDERLGQIEREGWTVEHDDRHAPGEMAEAAAAYAYAKRGDRTSALWPWDLVWWKPKGLHGNRVRAGALIVAELARHIRSASKS